MIPVVQPTAFENTLLWLYVLAMAAGAIIFVMMAQRPRGVPRVEYLIALFIPVWSGAAYLAMALGQGIVQIDGQTTYIPRYRDWVVTTPLLLLALSLTAFYKTKPDYVLVAGLVGADIFMILTGLIADLSTTPVRYVWYGLGVVAFCVILYLIWVPLRAQAQANPDGRIASVYVRAATFLTVFWVGYPIAWLIGPSGLALIGQEAESVLFIVLPVISKVGFSLYDLSLLRALDDGRTHARDVPTYAGAD